jgi:UV DNA damage endonuclease
MRIGYACLNTTLAEKKVTVNRGMIRRTFDAKGLAYTAELIRKNLQDLLTVLQWNYEQGISFYRMSSNMLPWMSEYELEELPGFVEIKTLLEKAGQLAKTYEQRLSFHPGPFNVLASAKKAVVQKTVKELNQHAEIMDLMQLSITPFNKINIHIGTTLQGEKEKAMENFCRNFEQLSPSAKSRLTVENDDKPNMYTIADLWEGIYQRIGIPLVFDYHHHLCHPGGQTQEEALLLACRSWPASITPAVHYSEPKSFDDRQLFRAHADYIERQIPTYGQRVDIMVEAKQKEGAVLRYREREQANKLEAPLYRFLNERI